jgi:hypothetical protein
MSVIRHRQGAVAATRRHGIQFGFSGGEIVGLGSTDLGLKLDAYQAAGAKIMRFDMSWDYVQRAGSSSWNWGIYDTVTSALQSRSITALPVIGKTPAWARSGGTTETPPTSGNYAAYATFCRTAVARYPSIRTWEIWNEPNVNGFSPTVYGAMLDPTYIQIKAQDPTVIVLSAGLSPAVTGGGIYSPVDWITSIYANGHGNSFDGGAMHPYCWFGLPGDGLDNGWTAMVNMRAIMVSNGDSAKGIWATECGAPTNQVTETFQATTATQAVAVGKTYPWLRQLLWYSVQDLGTDSAQDYLWYGLIRYDGSNKPSRAAWLAAIA